LVSIYLRFREKAKGLDFYTGFNTYHHFSKKGFIVHLLLNLQISINQVWKTLDSEDRTASSKALWDNRDRTIDRHPGPNRKDRAIRT
jgi:hypothetical protein